jgi:Ca2+-binding EF-hand superfamily protein
LWPWSRLGAIFKSLDRDGSGSLTIAEFQQLSTSAEVQKAHEAHAAAARNGKGGDHGIAEHAAHAASSPERMQAHFTKLDSNSDGVVTLTEIEQHHRHMEQSHKTR